MRKKAEYVQVKIPKAMYENLAELAQERFYDGNVEALILDIIRDYQRKRWVEDHERWQKETLEMFLIGLNMAAKKRDTTVADVVYRMFHPIAVANANG